MTVPRRHVLASAAALAAIASGAAPRSARATPGQLQAALREFVAGAVPRAGAKMTLDIAPLVENGNAVPVSITVDSPMSDGDRVTTIALFTARNPQTEVAVFTRGARAARARVDTRIRLATSQRLVAVARFADGSVAQVAADVIVTLAACVEG